MLFEMTASYLVFTQNLAEAEYAVALFMYMRLQGYPPDKIAILTTYNGQKHLIRDVLQKRCARNPVFGLPEKVCVCNTQIIGKELPTYNPWN